MCGFAPPDAGYGYQDLGIFGIKDPRVFSGRGWHSVRVQRAGHRRGGALRDLFLKLFKRQGQVSLGRIYGRDMVTADDPFGFTQLRDAALGSNFP